MTPQVELLQVRLIIPQAEGNYSSRHAAFFRKSFSSHQKGNYEHRNFRAEKIRRRNVEESLELQQHPIEHFRLLLSMNIFIICYLIAKYFSVVLCPQQEGVPSARVGLLIRIYT